MGSVATRKSAMGLPVLKPATYEDIFGLPENLVGEIINGRLVTHPRPAPKHAVACSSLGFEIGGPYDRGRDGPGGWRILDEPELHLDHDILVPDLAGWRRECMPKLSETAWFELPPDWVCEILSRRRQPGSIAPRSCPFTPATVSSMPGWSIPICAPWKCSRTAPASGCCC